MDDRETCGPTDSSAPFWSSKSVPLRAPAPLPSRIGRHRIVRLIGEGGMGRVFEAVQEDLNRRVAVKVIRSDREFPDFESVIARFEAERRVLAQMTHSSLTKVFDAGTTEWGDPYFVMEYVPGSPITAYCDENRLSLKDRLLLFTQVCRALQYAHQRGIIHRDIKPSNVLVTEQDGVAVPRVIDFGLAKAMGPDPQAQSSGVHVTQRSDTDLSQGRSVDETRISILDHPVGTPAYMSPEQVRCDQDIDTRTDIYSLGILLYELLTGTLPLPLQAMKPEQIPQIIEHEVPPTPSTRLRELQAESAGIAEKRRIRLPQFYELLRDDLDWVVGKCLSKARDDRYPSASALADDIKRSLSDRPIEARPATALYIGKKFVRRNRGWVAAAVAVLAVLIAGIVLTTLQANAARHERDRALRAELEQRKERERAVAARDEAEAEYKYFGQLLRNVAPETYGAVVTLRAFLDNATSSLGERFARMPEVEARIRWDIAAAYLRLGVHDQAMKNLNQISRILRNQGEERSRETLATMSAMASIFVSDGRAVAAETLLDYVLPLQRSILGDEDLDTLESLNTLAAAFAYQGRFPQAEKGFREVFAKRVKRLGADNPRTLMSHLNLAAAVDDLERRDEAERLYKDVMDRAEHVPGKVSRSIYLNAQAGLGATLTALGRYEESEALLRSSVEKLTQFYGSQSHDYVLRSRGYLAACLAAQGRIAEALELDLQSIQAASASLPPYHPTVTAIVDRLVGNLCDIEQFEAAEKHALEAYRQVEAADDASPIHVKTALRRVEQVYDVWNRTDSSDALQQKIATWRASHPESTAP